MAIVSSKGQVTLPKSVRDALGIEAGTELSFEAPAGHVAILRKQVRDADVLRWQGFLKGQARGRSTDEVITEMRGE